MWHVLVCVRACCFSDVLSMNWQTDHHFTNVQNEMRLNVHRIIAAFWTYFRGINFMRLRKKSEENCVR